MKKVIIGLLLCASLLTVWFTYRLVWGLPLNVNHFVDRAALEMLINAPEAMTMLGVIDNTPLDRHSKRLSDLSAEAQAQQLEDRRRNLALLQQYDRASLGGQALLSFDFFDYVERTTLDAFEFPWHFDNLFYQGPYPANQMDGAQTLPLTTLSDMHRVVDNNSANNYLARIDALPAYLSNVQQALVLRSQMGVIAPKHILRMLIEQTSTQVAQPAKHWSIYRALEQKLAATDIEKTEQEGVLNRAAISISSGTIPAYAAFLDTLLKLELSAPEQPGMWLLPDGDAYYAALLRLYTTTTLTPDEVHRAGLERVQQLQLEMGTALAGLGYAGNTIAEQVAQLGAAPAAYYPPAEDLAAQVLAQYSAMEARLEAGTAPAFMNLPDQALEVQASPPEKAGAAGAYYMPASLDGTRPGIFYVNLRKPEEIQRFGMLTLAAHEGIPGHHFQIAIAQRLEGIPFMRANSPLAAYNEGWALYAERLVYDLGLHDAESNIGRLQAEMFRAVRLVVDTGIHARRWSRDQAIDYMLENTGMPMAEVAAEIDRYIVMPGQACAYMTGMLEILKLREEAESRLGERFNLPEFHHAVLKNGALPLDLLRREVTAELQ
jgi:uncharacterized protein (DUF885 family)